jgi:hypothetical protein
MDTSQTILKKYAANIANLLAESSKEIAWEMKQRGVLDLLQDALAAIGKVYLVGGLPVLVERESGAVLHLMPGRDLDRFLDECGFLPGAGDWDRLLSRKLQSRLDIPHNFVHSIAHFDPEASVLYLNEWSGKFLRFDSEGTCTRHQVGEFEVIFDQAQEPHEPLDLDKINAKRGPALAWAEDSPLVNFIFSIGKFSESSGIGRVNCITVLILFTLAILFQERVLVIPVCHLCGLSGSKKSALSVALGWVLSGLGMKFSATACPENVSDVQNALINAKGLLVLDEANSLRPLTNLIKSVVTGGEFKKRILYTTDAEKTYPIDCSLMLPANFDSATDAALVARCLKIDMGNPGEDGEGWRGDFHVRQEWRYEGVRQRCWEDLVLRCAAIMRYLKAAVDKGEDDIRVQHRMSGFWSFAVAIAKQEGAETERMILGALEAITAEQRRSLNTFDDILPLLQSWISDSDKPSMPGVHAEPSVRGKHFSASEIGGILLGKFGYSNTMSQPVRDILLSSFKFSNKLNGTQEYRRLLGMEVHRGRYGKEFSFDPPTEGQ